MEHRQERMSGYEHHHQIPYPVSNIPVGYNGYPDNSFYPTFTMAPALGLDFLEYAPVFPGYPLYNMHPMSTLPLAPQILAPIETIPIANTSSAPRVGGLVTAVDDRSSDDKHPPKEDHPPKPDTMSEQAPWNLFDSFIQASACSNTVSDDTSSNSADNDKKYQCAIQASRVIRFNLLEMQKRVLHNGTFEETRENSFGCPTLSMPD